LIEKFLGYAIILKNRERQMSLNICIITLFDKKYKKMGEWCAKSIQRYAQKYHYNFKYNIKVESDRPVSWNKILIIQKLLEEGYDFVFFIDADAIFVRFDEDIADEIESDKDLYLVKHGVWEGYAPNAGVLLIRNSAWSKKMLSEVWCMENYINTVLQENGALLDYLGLLNDLPLSYRAFVFKDGWNPPNAELLKKVKWLDAKWNNIPGLIRIQNPIINHFCHSPLIFIKTYQMATQAYKTGLISKYVLLKNILYYFILKVVFFSVQPYNSLRFLVIRVVNKMKLSGLKAKASLRLRRNPWK
jgi:hypothetical protein